jgi:hypothetical protein
MRRYLMADELPDDVGHLLVRYQALPFGHPDADDLMLRIEDAERHDYEFRPDETIGDLFDGFEEPPRQGCVDGPAFVQDVRPRRAA